MQLPYCACRDMESDEETSDQSLEAEDINLEQSSNSETANVHNSDSEIPCSQSSNPETPNSQSSNSETPSPQSSNFETSNSQTATTKNAKSRKKYPALKKNKDITQCSNSQIPSSQTTSTQNSQCSDAEIPHSQTTKTPNAKPKKIRPALKINKVRRKWKRARLRASGDGAWQRRGSGRAWNSLTGKYIESDSYVCCKPMFVSKK